MQIIKDVLDSLLQIFFCSNMKPCSHVSGFQFVETQTHREPWAPLRFSSTARLCWDLLGVCESPWVSGIVMFLRRPTRVVMGNDH